MATTEVNAPEESPAPGVSSAPGPSGFPRRYRVIEEPEGFRVEGRDRHPVFVRLSPGKASLLVVGDPDDIGEYDEDAGTCDVVGSHYALYGYRQVLAAVAQAAMVDWNRPATPRTPWSGIYAWALGRTGRALHYGGVYRQWQRLLGLVPERQLQVAKAVFAATFDGGRVGCETWPALYERRFLVEDIVRYRAAAIACHYAEDLVAAVGASVAERRAQGGEGFLPGPVGEACAAHQARLARISRFPSDSLTYTRGRRALQREILELLAGDWKALFSGEGRAGANLRRTLMNLPGAIPGQLMCGLPRVDFLLRRPVTDRLELLALLLFARHGYYRYDSPLSVVLAHAWEGPIYANASRAKLLAALRQLSGHLHRELRPRTDGMAELVLFVRDYCQHCYQEETARHEAQTDAQPADDDYCQQEEIAPHRYSIVGLVDRAIRWHKRVQEETVKNALNGLADTTPLARPPIPLPENPAVRFLASVGDLFEEGLTMRHCITSFAQSALGGHCFLFHVDYKGTSASVEVLSNGVVAQSHGPRNATNAASLYGLRVLARWARRLPQAAAFPREGGDPFFDGLPD